MIKNEWKSLFKNKLLFLVILAVIAIPVIYAGLFLDSMWDPYGNVDKLPVAVVNQDVPVEYEGKTLKIGEDMVEELKENDSLQFNFVDEQAARDGLRNGTYYMVLTIPEKFSENATTLMDEEPQKMEIQYETNPGTNYIASKMSDTAVLKIKNNVQEQVIKTYTETVFDSISEAGDGMQEAADGSGKIEDGMNTASDGNKKITKNLKKLASSTVTFTDGAKQLQSGLKKYTDGVGTLNQKAPVLITGVGTLNQGASDLSDGAGTLSDGTKKYVDGTETLADGVTAYVAGVEKISKGAKQLAPLQSGLGDTYNGIKQLYSATAQDNYDGKGRKSLTTGTTELAAGLDTIYNSVAALEGTTSEAGLNKLMSGLSSARAGMENGAKGLAAASATINSANQGIQTGQAVLKNALDGEHGLNASVKKANETMKKNVEKANTQIDTANAKIEKVNDKIADVNAQIERSNTKVEKSEDAIAKAMEKLEAAEKSAKEKGVDLDLSAEKNALRSAKGELKKADKIDSVENAAKVEKMNAVDELRLEPTAAPTIRAITDGLSQASAGLKKGSDELSEGAKALSAGAGEIPSGLSNRPITELKNALGSAKKGASDLDTGARTLAGGLEKLENATRAFPAAGAGIAAVNDGFDLLSANNQKLTDGAAELKKQGTVLTSGADKLALGASQLSKGTESLSKGAGQLSAGVKKLADNNDTLNRGMKKLASGSVKISDGSRKLADGSEELGDGMKKLKNGSVELKEALADGAKKVKDSKAEEHNIKMFSAPVEHTGTMMTEVENNGHAMAPYMMAVALWVGCLAFCLLYPLMEYEGKLKSGLAWWASKATVLYPVALLQGLVLILALHYLIGFTPVRMAQTLAFACLTAVTFTSIMYFFNITLGKVGSFLMLVFMVVQLAGSSGTYPMELSPAFVAKIHWYLPFTYVVNSFRSTIAGGESIQGASLVMLVWFAVFTVLTIAAFVIKAKRRKENKWILFDWLEEKGLA